MARQQFSLTHQAVHGNVNVVGDLSQRGQRVATIAELQQLADRVAQFELKLTHPIFDGEQLGLYKNSEGGIHFLEVKQARFLLVSEDRGVKTVQRYFIRDLHAAPTYTSDRTIYTWLQPGLQLEFMDVNDVVFLVNTATGQRTEFAVVPNAELQDSLKYVMNEERRVFYLI